MKQLFFTCFALLALLNAHATKHVITAAGTSFSPNNITNVLVGDTIRWERVNNSHTTTSVTIPSTAAPWNAPLNSTTTSFEYPVTVAGTYTYKCVPHELMGMTGSFTATDPVSNPCDTLDCNDNNACTTDTCTNSICVNTPVVCDDADSCTTDGCLGGVCQFTPISGCGVGIKDISFIDLNVYPNPVHDILTIDGIGSTLTRVIIADISGKQLYDSGQIRMLQHSIKTETFPEGVYLLHIHTAAGQTVRKVLAER